MIRAASPWTFRPYVEPFINLRRPMLNRDVAHVPEAGAAACNPFRAAAFVCKTAILESHTGPMQVQCHKCEVIVAIGATKWFFDGGECRELRGTEAGEAGAYEKCPVLIEAVAKAKKNAATPRPPHR